MRVLKTLIISLLVISGVAGLVGLLAREVWLFVAVSQVKSSISTMKRASAQSGSYLQTCLQKGPVDRDQPVIGEYRLRFETSTSYVVEVVCAQFPLSPIEIERASLPWLVTKVPGTSGLRWSAGRSGIQLELFGRLRSVVVEDQQILSTAQASSDVSSDLGVGPITSCAGYGLTCCNLDTQLGQGLTTTQATDCPKTCFQSCQNRPVVLSLTSEPFADPATKILTISPGESVLFYYVIESSPGFSAELSFGDGTQTSLTEKSGNTSHVYSCSTGRCEYSVTLRVTTADGVSSADTPLTRLTVVVKP